MQRVEAHEPLPPLDTIRYQLPAPTSAEPNDEEWQNALKNAYAQQEHQLVRYAVSEPMFCEAPHSVTLRQSNLSLLQKYGSNAWKIHNYRLDSTAKQAEQSLEELKQLTTDVNRERKNFQVSTHDDCFMILHRHLDYRSDLVPSLLGWRRDGRNLSRKYFKSKWPTPRWKARSIVYARRRQTSSDYDLYLYSITIWTGCYHHVLSRTNPLACVVWDNPHQRLRSRLFIFPKSVRRLLSSRIL